MTLKNNSLTKNFYYHLLAGIICSLLIIGLFWLISSYFQLRSESAFLQQQTQQRQMETLKERVESVVNLIEQERQLTHEHMLQNIQQRTKEAHSLISQLYEQGRQLYSPEQLKQIIKTTLRSIRFNNGRGYFFALDMHGIMQIYPPDPATEGTSFLDKRDSRGQRIIADMIELVTEKQQGLYEYTWPKPEDPLDYDKKIAAITYFEPFDWFIGTGEYISDVTTELQTNLLEQIEKIRFADGSYIFVANYAAVGLTYPAKGKDISAITDQNGIHIVQELIKLAKQGGGYLTYIMPPLQNERSTAKISYVTGIPDWQWYIGSGALVEDINADARNMLAMRSTAMHYKIALLCLVLLLFFAIIWYTSNRFARQVSASFRSFLDFFDKAAHTAEPLLPDQQPFSEFRELAQSANLMLEARCHFEEEAIEFQNQLHNIIDAMPSIVAAVDDQGQVVYWNQFAAQRSNTPAPKAVGQKIGRLLPYLENMIPEILRNCHRQQRYQHNLQIRDSGSNRHISISAYPLSDKRPLQIVVRIDDITDQIRIEEMMMQTEKMLSIGGLAAGMAHEINNPLSIISQAAQNTSRRLSANLPANRTAADEVGIDLDKLQQYLEKRSINSFLSNISQAVVRSSQIIQSMLNFTAASASERERCNVAQLIENSLTMAGNDYDLKKKYNFRGIRITTNIAQGLPDITANHIEMEQMLFNLLKNAGQAMVDVKRDGFEPAIDISATAEEGNIIIKLSDNGPGIPASIRSRVMEPFFTTKEIGVGSGLGLSVAYFIVVKRHQGHFLIDSAVDQGTTFTITLPIETSA